MQCSLGNELTMCLADLHSVWDNLLIAKAIRETPRNYTHPLPSRRIEGALRGAIYDPYIRQIVWEGLLGQWKEDTVEWASCPTPSKPGRFSFANAQLILNRLVGTGVPNTDDSFVCPYAWASEIHPLNCEVAWPAKLDETDYNAPEGVQPETPLLELDEPWYSGRIRKELIVERLLATGGIRLAAILNDIFADPDDEVAPLIDL